MELVATFLFLYLMAIYAGGLPDPVAMGKWIAMRGVRTSPTQDDTYSMKRIAELERQSMAYWEERFIAAGGDPSRAERERRRMLHEKERELKSYEDTRLGAYSGGNPRVPERHPGLGDGRPVSKAPIRVDYSTYRSIYDEARKYAD